MSGAQPVLNGGSMPTWTILAAGAAVFAAAAAACMWGPLAAGWWRRWRAGRVARAAVRGVDAEWAQMAGDRR